MDIERMEKLLPEKPRFGMDDRYFMLRSKGELGGEFLIFHRESITIEPDIRACMSPEDWAVHSKNTKRRWGSICFCTACGEEFTAGYCNHKNVRGIELGQGADGQLYDGYPYNEYGDTEWDCVVEIAEAENIQCPICGSDVRVIRKSDLRYGRTYQLAVASVENVEQYTALVTWLIRRRIDADGFWIEDIRPRDALVIDEKGRLQHFAHTRAGGSNIAAEVDLENWEYRKSFLDGFQKKYYNYDSCDKLEVGGICYSDMPPIGGTTGEKSGIDVYIQNGGSWPHMYLKLWQKHRNVENLIKAGWIGLIEKSIDHQLKKSFYYYGKSVNTVPEIKGIDWKEKKPHKMLGMTKEESKVLKNAFYDPDVFGEWSEWRDGPQKISATAFSEFKKEFEDIGTICMLRMLYHDFGEEWEIGAVMRYVRQHKEMRPADVVQTLLDYRNMYREQHRRRRKFKQDELWPVALRREHDVISEQKKIKESEEERKKMLDGFIAVREKYGDLEWTDGELCIRLPRDNGELYTEGTVLRHCVKGYGKDHIAGRDTIFFVRKYRRPERSYYTLDIRMTDGMPREVQLHGYGNERHGKHLEQTHHIPPKVRAFVDRWKKEILIPWYAQQQKVKKKSEKVKERKTA